MGTDSPILFSSHTDTVHKAAGKQQVIYGQGTAWSEDSNCLGADDTTGVWLMMNMIRAGVPGTYVFHSDEEIGGLGSNFVAKKLPHKLKGIKYAIAFDRKGYVDIVTHQFAGMTASDEFAKSLASILHPLTFAPSDGGTFTDTANYADIVPECSNLAVGYFHQHTAKEWQDCDFAIQLLDALIAADWSKLVCKREPGDYGETIFSRHSNGHFNWDEYDTYPSSGGARSTPLVQVNGASYYAGALPNKYTVAPTGTAITWPLRATKKKATPTQTTVEDYCRRYPQEVAMFLESCGFNVADMEDFIYEARGNCTPQNDAPWPSDDEMDEQAARDNLRDILECSVVEPEDK